MSQKRKKTSPKVRMHPAYIKAEIEIAESSIIEIARALKITPPSVANVVHHRSKSHRVAQEIAKVTGLPIEKLFADDYAHIQSSTGERHG